jgi:hypothetical protein
MLRHSALASIALSSLEHDRDLEEAAMRSLTILLVVLPLAVLAIGGSAGATQAAPRVRLAQTSTTTNCMVTCNTQLATCQSACIVPGTAPTGAATTTSNATASSTCLLNCSTQQLSCQTNCAAASPSQ